MLKAAICICVIVWVAYAAYGAAIIKQVDSINKERDQILEQLKKDLEV